FTFQVHSFFTTFDAEQSEAYVSQIPVLTVREGRITTPENRPYSIIDPASKEVIAVIDTSGQYTTLEQANTNLLITEDKILTHPRENEKREYQIPESYSGDIVPELLHEKFRKFVGYLWIPLFLS